MHITEPLPGEKRARLVFGLEWRAYPVKEAKDGRSRYAEDFSATHCVEMKVGEEMLGGFCAPEPSVLRRVKLYSGAARVAMLDRVRAKAAVLVLMQDEQMVHLVYVVRGAVHNDEVVSLAAVAKRREDIAQQCARQGLALLVLASGSTIEAGDESFSPAELLQLKNVGRIKRVPVGVPNVVMVLLVFAVVGFAGKAVYGAFNPPPIVSAGPSWKQSYDQAVEAAFVHAPLASKLAPQLLARFDAVETNRDGFQFDHAKCPASGYCALTYRRMGGAFEDFARRAPASMLPFSFDRSGNTLHARGPAVPTVQSVLPAARQDWPDEQSLIKVLLTPPQRMSTQPEVLRSFGYEVHIEPSRALLSTPPPANETHGSLIREGTWEIDGYRWQGPLLERLPANMTLETLEEKLDTAAPDELGKVGIHFVARGKFYVVQ
jgi:hypothetical protein